MSEKKIITVFGATGAQGSGLVHAILNDPEGGFAVRAVTRDPSSEKARALAAAGAEVVQGDIDNPQSVRKALDGAYGAYFVTFFWDHYSAEKEYEQVHNYAQAAKEAGIQHAIWSTLEDTRKWVPLDDDRMPTLGGKYKVPHFDGKGAADQHFVKAGVPTTFLIASFYWENLVYFGAGPKRGEDGKLYLTFPMGDKKLACIASDDIGKCAYGIFKKGKELTGKTIGIAGEHLTISDMATSLSKAIGEEVVYNEVSPDTYRSFGFPGADDLGNMFQFYRDFEKDGLAIRDIGVSRSLNPELQTFDTWLSAHADKIPLN